MSCQTKVPMTVAYGKILKILFWLATIFYILTIHSIGNALIVALFGDKTGNTARIYFLKFSYTLLSVNNKLYSKTQNFSD